MDTNDVYYVYLGLALISMLLVVAKGSRRGRSPAHGQGLRLPPGPWQVPIIGSLHHIALGAMGR